MRGGVIVKKIPRKILSFTADIALEVLLASAGLASIGGSYQPKDPPNLKLVAEKRKKKRNGYITT